MTDRFGRILLALLLLALATACSSSPAQPSGTTTGGTASITAPRPAQPADGTQVQYSGQPVTLVVQNAVVTQGSTKTYTFEVATDTAFGSKVQTRDVSEGTNGQTSVKLDMLAGATTYYWHARAQSAGTVGLFGPTYKLSIGAAVIINVPIPIGPLTGAATSSRPTFVVANAARSGPAGPITYRFEISSNSSFNPVGLTGTVNEGVGQTSYSATSDLAANQTFYWRVTAIDAANGASSPASPAQTFTTSANTRQAQLAAQLGVPLWPGIQPTGTNGSAKLGDNWDVQTRISFDGRRFTSPPLGALEVFDLMDRGMSPQAAIDWMHNNGYPDAGVYYFVGTDVIGFDFVYIAKDKSGAWDLVIRVGA